MGSTNCEATKVNGLSCTREAAYVFGLHYRSSTTHHMEKLCGCHANMRQRQGWTLTKLYLPDGSKLPPHLQPEVRK
jgi:hypothetical protein